MSFLLFNELVKEYIQTFRERMWLLLLYVMLPGILSSALILSHASIVLFGLLFYFYLLNHYEEKLSYPLLIIYTFVDGGFAYLFFGLAIYALFVKRYKFLLFNIILFSISGYLHTLQIYGVPSGHFLDTLGVYSAIFTPIVFVYMVYVLYRRFLADKIDRLWYVSTSVLIFSLILSFRQRLDIEYFAPYLIIALPLAAKTFTHSYRVRLKQFRKRYKVIFIFSFILLILNMFAVVMNKYIYIYIDNPKKHFAYKMHIAKELANSLQEKGFHCVNTTTAMQQRLKFYNIEKCPQNYLQELSLDTNNDSDVTVSYKGKTVYKGNVTKININNFN
jgi:lysylphosphatidylglycerol synthetase-like protein (DUF2156 family)